MLKMVKLIIVVALSVAAIGCGSSGRMPLAKKALTKANLVEYWNFSVARLLDDGDKIAELKLLDEKLYCLTDKGMVIAIEAATGVVTWSRKIAGPHERIMGLCHFNKLTLPPEPLNISQIGGWKLSPNTVQFNAVIINTMSFVLVMDRDTGQEYRKIDLTFSTKSATATDGLNIYVGSTNGRFYTLAIPEALQVWGRTTGGMISSPPKVYAGNVYVASEDKHIYSATPQADNSRGKFNWSQELLGPITTQFHVDLRGCFVSGGERVYAFDPISGRPLWTPFVCRGALNRDIQVGENTIFQYADNDGLYAINLSNGRKRWHNKQGLRVLAAFEGEVYVLTNDKVMMVVDEMLGTVKYNIPLGCMDLFADNVNASAIYAATSDGGLLCIRRAEAGVLTSDMLIKK